jgi:hypothetical protein
VSVELSPPPQAAISAAMPSSALALRQLGARRCSRKPFVSSGFMIRLLSILAFRVIELQCIRPAGSVRASCLRHPNKAAGTMPERADAG